MFSNSCYSTIKNGRDDYRSVGDSFDDMINLIFKNCDTIFEYGILRNIAINTSILILAIALFETNKGKFKNKSLRFVSKLSLYIVGGYVAFSFMNCIGNNTVTTEIINIGYIFTILFVISMFVFFVSLPIDRIRKTKLLFYLLSIAVLFGPLLVVNPISERCFYPTYVMFTVLVVEMYGNLKESIKCAVDKYRKLGTTFVITTGLYLIFIFSIITNANNKRIEMFRSEVEVGYPEIVIKKLPFEKYVHCSSPTDEIWIDRYKMYYGIPENTEVIFKDYKY